MATIDGSAVNLVLPAIANQYGATMTSVGWVSTIYLLFISILLLPAGSLASRIGERRLYQLGIFIFTVASALCATSRSLPLLIVSRALQGIGAALTSALGTGFVAHAFPESKRGMALGMIGSVVAAGSLTGPIFGGTIAHTFGWSAIFWINLPIGITALSLSYSWLAKDPDRSNSSKPSFDYSGAIYSGIGLLLFLLTLSESATEGKTLFTLGLIGTVTMFTIFILHELKIANPMLPMSLFRNRLFSSNSLFGIINTSASIQALLTLPFFFAEVKKFDMKTMGFYMSVWPLALAMVAPFAGRAADRLGSRTLLLVGPLVQVVGLVMFACIQVESSQFYLITAIALTGIGGAIFVPANNKSLLGSVPKQFLFMASSVMSLIRNVGMVTGIALAAAIVQLMRQFSESPTTAEGFLYGMHWSMIGAALLGLISGVGPYFFLRSKKEEISA